MHIIFYCNCLLSSHKLAPDLPPLLAFITSRMPALFLVHLVSTDAHARMQLLWFLPGCHTAVPLHFSFSQVESSSTKDVCSVPFAILFHNLRFISLRGCAREKGKAYQSIAAKQTSKFRGVPTLWQSKPITSPCFLHSYSVLNWMIIR